MTFSPTVFDSDILAIDEPGLFQALAKCVHEVAALVWRASAEETYERYRGALCTCSQRRCRRYAKDGEEAASLHALDVAIRPIELHESG